jgi:hypothetical protein
MGLIISSPKRDWNLLRIFTPDQHRSISALNPWSLLPPSDHLLFPHWSAFSLAYSFLLFQQTCRERVGIPANNAERKTASLLRLSLSRTSSLWSYKF